MLTILSEMARGNAVRVIPHHAELTTGEAANLLNVSRPYVVRLLDEGRIPSHKVGTHRHVDLKDVMAYREERYRARSDVLDRMAAIRPGAWVDLMHGSLRAFLDACGPTYHG